MASYSPTEWINELTDAIALFEQSNDSLTRSIKNETLPHSVIRYQTLLNITSSEYTPLPDQPYTQETLARVATRRMKDDKSVLPQLYGVVCTQLAPSDFEQLNKRKVVLKEAILNYRKLKGGKRGRVSTMARSLVQDKSVPRKIADKRDYAASLLNAYDLLSCYAPIRLLTAPVKTIAFSWQKQPAQVNKTNVKEVLAVAQKQSSPSVLAVTEQKLQGFDEHQPLAIKRVVGTPRMYANIRYTDNRLEKCSVRSVLLLHQESLPEIRWPETLPHQEVKPREPSKNSTNGTVAANSLIDALNVYEYDRDPQDNKSI